MRLQTEKKHSGKQLTGLTEALLRFKLNSLNSVYLIN